MSPLLFFSVFGGAEERRTEEECQIKMITNSICKLILRCIASTVKAVTVSVVVSVFVFVAFSAAKKSLNALAAVVQICVIVLERVADALEILLVGVVNL